MADEVLLVLSTWPDVERARAAAQILVEEKLIACANLLPGVESIYRWQGEVEQSGEVLMFIKTTSNRYGALAKRVRDLHTYEVPELIALRVSEGLADYLRWVAASCVRSTE